MTSCNCGSGAHPRRCKEHHDAFDTHVAWLNLENDLGEEMYDAMFFFCAQLKHVGSAIKKARTLNEMTDIIHYCVGMGR